MRKDAPDEFGRAVKVALMDQGRTQEWLVGELRETTGLYVDSAYVSKILTGERHPPKIIEAIKKILCLDNCTAEGVPNNGL